MLDVFQQYSEGLNRRPPWDGTTPANVYMTLHRPQNVDDRDCHLKIIEFVRQSGASFVFPLHPRTEKKLAEFGLVEAYSSLPNLRLSGAIGYVDSIREVLNADLIVTDSGGLQKEAYFAGKMSMLMLPDTPWPELETSGWQLLGGWVRDGGMAAQYEALRLRGRPAAAPPFFGKGDAAVRIVDALVAHGLVGEQ
jgi:UDP-N-acetylglucosamine 2-epimerase